MSELGLKLKLEQLTHEGQPFAGVISVDELDPILRGLVGDLGYRPLIPCTVDGTVYLAGCDVIIDVHFAQRVGFGCVRCLEAQTLEVDVRFHHVISRKIPATAAGDLEIDVDDPDAIADVDVSYFEGDLVDLVPVIREYLVLELPMNPTCGDTAAGLCEKGDGALTWSAGIPVDDSTVDGAIDPRWAPLLELKKKLN